MKNLNSKILFLSLGLMGGITFISNAAPLEEVVQQEAVDQKKVMTAKIKERLDSAESVIFSAKQQRSFDRLKETYKALIDSASVTLFTKPDTSTPHINNFFVLTQPPSTYWFRIINGHVLPFLQQNSSPNNKELMRALTTLKNANSALTNSFNIRTYPKIKQT